MNQSKHSKTLDYYNKNAANFAQRTLNVDMTKVANRFLKCLPENSLILDFGCGAGRDSKYFLSQNYQVDSLDGSLELAKIAEELTGQPVIVSDFNSFIPIKKYDGIWACASLVHLNNNEIEDILEKLISFLKQDGILYFSLKDGNFKGLRDGRYFNYLTQKELFKILNRLENIKILEYWISEDARKDRGTSWHNIILKNERNS